MLLSNPHPISGTTPVLSLYKPISLKLRFKLAWGPLGTAKTTAKTTWLCWRAYAICERAAAAGLSARIIYIRDTYRNLIDSTYATWNEWFAVPGAELGYALMTSKLPIRNKNWDCDENGKRL
jgi:hypothetical protein